MVEWWGSGVRTSFRFGIHVNEITSLSIYFYICKPGTTKMPSHSVSAGDLLFVSPVPFSFLLRFAIWPRKLTLGQAVTLHSNWVQWEVLELKEIEISRSHCPAHALWGQDRLAVTLPERTCLAGWHSLTARTAFSGFLEHYLTLVPFCLGMVKVCTVLCSFPLTLLPLV